jgi:DHA3 family tetracycline resistance protein-like MFS transporter
MTVFTVNLLYHVETVGLTPLQLVLVGTTLETVIVLFEVPTGIVADLVSRRRSVLIGLVLIGAGFIVEGSLPVFGAILAAQVLWGLGYTFTSGATEAWITDEVGEEQVGPVLLRGTQASLIGTFVGIVLATALGLISIRLPIVLGGVGFVVLAIMLRRWMPETNFRPTPKEDRSTFAQMAHIFRDGLRVARSRPVVRVLLLASLLVGLSSEAFDRLWAKHLIDDIGFPPIAGDNDLVLWFGVIALVGTLISLVATELFNRVHPESLGPGTPTRVLALLAGGRVLATLVFALAGSLPLALGMLWTRSLIGSLFHPVTQAWMNRNIEPRTRATVLSFQEQIGSVGEIGGGPPLGWVGSRFGVRTALVAGGLVFAPVISVFLRASHLRDHVGVKHSAQEEGS